ncbi:hypothetical protein [Enterobacter ludwigii]
MTRLIEMVVTKGRSVVHDGKTYGQHSRIMLPPNEAIRLGEMGFVLALSVVRNQLHDPDGGGSAGAGAAGEGSAGDGAGAAGEGSAGDGPGTATGNAGAKNTAGKNAKKTGA